MTKKDLQRALPPFAQFVRRLGPPLDDDSRLARAGAPWRGLRLDADDNQNAATVARNACGGDTSPARLAQHPLGPSPWPYLPLRAAVERDDLPGPERWLVVGRAGIRRRRSTTT